jgi:hypothetical protein
MVSLGRYRHFKGTVYTVVLVARHSENEEPMVVYHRSRFPDLRDESVLPLDHFQAGEWWVRPARMFEEEVCWPDGVRRPRFVREDLGR